MQKVPITLASPGMILAKPILNDKGMPLCADGTTLTETLIDRLRAMNITVITVKGRPLGDVTIKTIDEKLAELDERFTHVKGDPIMDRIHDAIVQAMKAQDAENAAMEAKEGPTS